MHQIPSNEPSLAGWSTFMGKFSLHIHSRNHTADRYQEHRPPRRDEEQGRHGDSPFPKYSDLPVPGDEIFVEAQCCEKGHPINCAARTLQPTNSPNMAQKPLETTWLRAQISGADKCEAPDVLGRDKSNVLLPLLHHINPISDAQYLIHCRHRRFMSARALSSRSIEEDHGMDAVSLNIRRPG